MTNLINCSIQYLKFCNAKDVRFLYNFSNKSFVPFPANIWIFKFKFCLSFAIKMLLNNTYGILNLLESKSNCFNSLFKQNMNLKMLAGKGTKELFERFFKNLRSLVETRDVLVRPISCFSHVLMMSWESEKLSLELDRSPAFLMFSWG